MTTKDIFEYELADLPLSQIDTGSRKRKDFGDLDAFAAELDQFGLYHPILVLEKAFVNGLADHSKGGLDPGKPYLLLAGERRLRAAFKNKWDLIACKITQREMDEWEIRVVELHENLKRKQMTPVEESVAVDEIHSLYQGIYGVAERGPGSDGHSEADTAQLLGTSRGTVSRHLETAKYLEVLPELKEAKTKTEARKMVQTLKEKLAREELARREQTRREKANRGVDTRSDQEKRRSLLMQRYIVGDAFEEIVKVDTRTIDLIELDPDWGISFGDRLEKQRGSLAHQDYVDTPPEEYEAHLTRIIKEVSRVMKDNAWMIVWYSMEDWHDTTRKIISDLGFYVCPMPAFWVHTSNVTGTPAYRLGQRTESFFYCRKGSPRIGKMGHGNTFPYRTLTKTERKHPAEKPIELYQDIISTFLGDRKGAICLSMFLGSGNFLLASDNLKHNVIGFDSKQKNKDDYILKVAEGKPGEYCSYKA